MAVMRRRRELANLLQEPSSLKVFFDEESFKECVRLVFGSTPEALFSKLDSLFAQQAMPWLYPLRSNRRVLMKKRNGFVGNSMQESRNERT